VTLDCASGPVQQQELNLDSSQEVVSSRSSGACQSPHPSVIRQRTVPSKYLKNLDSEGNTFICSAKHFLSYLECSRNLKLLIIAYDILHSSSVVVLQSSKETDLGMNSTYSHFNNSKVLASTPSGTTRSPPKKKSTSGPRYSKTA